MVNLADLAPEQSKKDFRRANGAPMVSDPDRPGKTLRYSRPSGWGKELDDESALVIWRINAAIKGVAHDRGLAAKIVAAGEDKEALKDLRDEATQAGRGNEASDIGTALHAMSQRYDAEDGWVAPEPFGSRLAQYRDIITTAGLTPEYVECRMVNDPMRTAGTADRIYRTARALVVPNGTIIDAGSLIMADLKTGKSLEYSTPGYCVQLALYADSVFYDLDTDERLPAPHLNPEWGLLVHLPADGNTCTLWWCDLEIGRTGARLVRDIRAWRKRNDHVQNFNFPDEAESLLRTELGATPIEHDGSGPDVDPATGDEAETQVAPEHRDSDSGAEAEPRSEMGTHPDTTNDYHHDEMVEWMQARIKVIGSHRSARTHLLRLWPEGLPTMRAGGHSRQQIMQVHELLSETEKAFSLPFTQDPRVKYHKGHRSKAS